MANNQLLAGLINPTYLEGLQQVGQMAGAAPAVSKQRGMLTELYGNVFDPNATQAQFSSTAQQLAAAGQIPQAMEVMRMGQNVADRRRQQTEFMTEQQKGITEESMLKRLRLNAMNKAQKLMDMEQDPTKKMKFQNELNAMRSSNDPEFLRNYLMGTSVTADYRVLDTIQIRDSKGNQFTETTRINNADPSAEPIKSYSLVGQTFIDEKGNKVSATGNESPIGTPTIISGTTGAGRFDEPGIKADIKGAETFAVNRQEAIESLPSLEKGIMLAEKSLETLSRIQDTGGFNTAIVRSIREFLGEEPADEAAFNLLAGQRVLENLNSFTGAISEGERNYLVSLFESLKRSKGANRAILLEMLDVAKRTYRDAKIKAISKNEKEYLKNRVEFGSELDQPESPQPVEISFGDLPRGS